jgi:hypothetical protein
MWTLLAAALLVPTSLGQAPGSFDGCPIEGQTTRQPLRALNRLKNRTVAPLRINVNPDISLPSVLRPGNDVMRWSPSQAAIITGYVVAVKPGGPETVNCGATDPAHTDTCCNAWSRSDFFIPASPRFDALRSGGSTTRFTRQRRCPRRRLLRNRREYTAFRFEVFKHLVPLQRPNLAILPRWA